MSTTPRLSAREVVAGSVPLASDTITIKLTASSIGLKNAATKSYQSKGHPLCLNRRTATEIKFISGLLEC